MRIPKYSAALLVGLGLAASSGAVGAMSLDEVADHIAVLCPMHVDSVELFYEQREKGMPYKVMLRIVRKSTKDSTSDGKKLAQMGLDVAYRADSLFDARMTMEVLCNAYYMQQAR